MTKLFAVLFLLALFITHSVVSTNADVPGVPNTSVVQDTLTAAASSTPAVAAPKRTRVDQSPARVLIPTIGLNSPIQNMGLTTGGAMDVPNGKTNNVGWYAAGTLPGEQGSAVLDAHVFAAFKNLSKLKVGDDIYVIAQDGAVQHFVAAEREVTALAQVSAQKLFARDDAQRLNLITCAGALTKDHSTYTHRLIISAVLAS